ncbi:MAG: polysaccharide deacetylase, partial [Methylocystis sp.]
MWTCVAGVATARGEDSACAPVDIAPSPTPAASRVKNYAPVFESCASESGSTRLAIRRMSLDGTPLILTVDPQSLQTSLERAACWRCEATSDAAQAETRYL